jgi:phosphotransferase system HPr (HPr) family protein
MNESKERTWLRGPLHARPAGLLVRLAGGFDARVTIATCEHEADTRNMLDLLALGADEGDRVELRADGPGAEAALVAIRELIERNFDQGLVPEVGHSVVPGIAIGRAALVAPRASRSAPALAKDHEHRRARAALTRARKDLALLIENLDGDERALFTPEVDILDALEPRLFAAIEAGRAAEDAAEEATEVAAHDLMLDARARLLDALDEGVSQDVAADADGGPLILVVRTLTPTLVARLSPEVAGLVVLAEDAREGGKAASLSHAVLLARGRGLPLAFVDLAIADSIARGAWVIIDASGEQARVWVDPDATRLGNARARKADEAVAYATQSVRAREPLAHLSFSVRTNLSSLSEIIPDGAEGVGLLRTELLFAGRVRAPSLTEQVNAFARIVTDARGGLVTIRLFDGGADKPLPWLPQPEGEAALRGIGLLFAHPNVLLTQLRAIAAIAGRADVRVLVPMTRTVDDIARVRAMAKPGTTVGAMIESTDAVHAASSIATASDFVSIGTNDLAASLADAPRESGIRATTAHVFREVRRIVDAARDGGKPVTVCGELAAEKSAALVLAGLGVNAISVAPSRFLDVKLALLGATREECARVAEVATA